ncbi:uncharacterized protein LOC121384620 [Gigantopelta aegis]|uniref:uncharacterized protein LOC121384620 n=1 Tax=Gigantopelta aegis TaxID=1735272 RepID=UPI001B88E366|nr:uncharacterized protein LOC121384620 [Gigantopelta aegis]
MDVADSGSQMSLEQKRSPRLCEESSWFSRIACVVILVTTALHTVAMALPYWQKANFQDAYFYHQGIWHMCVKSVFLPIPGFRPGPNGTAIPELWQCAAHQFHLKPELPTIPGAPPAPTGKPDIPHLFHDWLKVTRAFVVLATLAGILGSFAAVSFTLLPRVQGRQYFGLTAVALSLATGLLILLGVIIFGAKSQKILPSPHPFIQELPELKYDWAFGVEILCAIVAFVPGGLLLFDLKSTVFRKYTQNIA